MFHKIILVFSLVLIVIGLSDAIANAQGPKPGGSRAPAVALGTAFTYQGQLKQNGNAVNANCDFQFTLFDDPSAGAPVGTMQTKTNIGVTNGLFTIPDLDFGAGAFNGNARWLLTAVRCPTNTGIFAPLTPRTALTAAPYALYSTAANTAVSATTATSATNFTGNLSGDVTGTQSTTAVANGAVTAPKLSTAARTHVVAVQIGDVAAGTGIERPIFVAPGNGTIVAVSLTTNGLFFNSCTNYTTMSVERRTAFTSNAVKAFTTQSCGGSSFELGPVVHRFTSGLANTTLAANDLYSFKKVDTGTGQAVDELLVTIEYTVSE